MFGSLSFLLARPPPPLVAGRPDPTAASCAAARAGAVHERVRRAVDGLPELCKLRQLTSRSAAGWQVTAVAGKRLTRQCRKQGTHMNDVRVLLFRSSKRFCSNTCLEQARFKLTGAWAIRSTAALARRLGCSARTVLQGCGCPGAAQPRAGGSSSTRATKGTQIMSPPNL